MTKPDVTVRALAALNRQKEFKRISAELEEDKAFFRTEAKGTQLEVPVEGVGKVTVKTPGAPVSTFGLDFNEDAFNELSDTFKKKLIAAGVVKRVRVTRPASAAAVSFALNT